MNKVKKYVFHSDAGHGWLAVKRAELIDLNVLHLISRCSFQRGKTVYLEEDCDAGIFITALENNGGTFKHIEANHRDYSPIRNYDGFRA